MDADDAKEGTTGVGISVCANITFSLVDVSLSLLLFSCVLLRVATPKASLLTPPIVCMFQACS